MMPLEGAGLVPQTERQMLGGTSSAPLGDGILYARCGAGQLLLPPCLCRPSHPGVLHDLQAGDVAGLVGWCTHYQW